MILLDVPVRRDDSKYQESNTKSRKQKTKCTRLSTRVVIDRLWTEIGTLNWVLIEILVLTRVFSVAIIFRNINRQMTAGE